MARAIIFFNFFCRSFKLNSDKNSEVIQLLQQELQLDKQPFFYLTKLKCCTKAVIFGAFPGFSKFRKSNSELASTFKNRVSSIKVSCRASSTVSMSKKVHSKTINNESSLVLCTVHIRVYWRDWLRNII